MMDNLLDAHKGQRIKELIEEGGCELLYIPPYSADLNPVEEAFSKIKWLLREAEVLTLKTLNEAMGATISAVTNRDVCGLFEHCGGVSRFNHYDQRFSASGSAEALG